MTKMINIYVVVFKVFFTLSLLITSCNIFFFNECKGNRKILINNTKYIKSQRKFENLIIREKKALKDIDINA